MDNKQIITIVQLCDDESILLVVAAYIRCPVFTSSSNITQSACHNNQLLPCLPWWQ